jgi:hypothetical protein
MSFEIYDFEPIVSRPNVVEKDEPNLLILNHSYGNSICILMTSPT